MDTVQPQPQVNRNNCKRLTVSSAGDSRVSVHGMRTAVSGVSALPGRNVRMRCVTIATAFVLLVALTAVDQWQLDRLMAGSLNETQLTWINDTYCNQYLIFFY